ncbi:thiamine biosynthesis protein ThiJ [Chryseobacterium formosense]|uniref:Thiamine biosynthesis protein ThiJ n=1 Tax=Chryseobacterium formosense TaxID=236814 RepID=A0A085Z973_9FLAO|nr:type 1 glutamine amidotransferase domain-containing protein [Chryseobacterium formosense]KFF00987.1 thiamine biosynthesis protein ThiJ [Chryseobacterium formosense]SFT40450.1 Putative intracellular protease/amidase [Chryseobacterium formosense]
MKPKVLIIVSNANTIGPNNRRTGTFLPEVAHPYAEFEKADYEIDFVSLTGESPFLDALNLADDPDNLKFLTGKGWEKMHSAPKLSSINTDDYDAVFIPGGLAPMVDMPENTELKKIIAGFYESNRIVGAVCHGPVSLLNVKLSDGNYLVNGKNIASFTTEEEDNYAKNDVPFDLQTALTEQGAIFHAAEPWSANSIVDGNLVTGQNPASAKGVGEKMVTLIESKNS